MQQDGDVEVCVYSVQYTRGLHCTPPHVYFMECTACVCTANPLLPAYCVTGLVSGGGGGEGPWYVT